MRAALLLTGVLALAAIPAPASAGSIAAAGVGEGGTFSFCNPNVRIAVAGVNDDAGNWVFQFVMQRHPNCIVVLLPAVFEGRWDPIQGGCMAGAPPVGGTLCLGGIPEMMGTTSWWLCGQAAPCDPPNASFVGTIQLTVVG